MKKLLFLTLISISMQNSITAMLPALIKPETVQSVKTPENTISSDEQFANLYELCTKQYNFFYQELLHGLNLIDKHIAWWKSEQNRSVHSSLTQSPRFWFKSMSYEDRIIHSIFRLKIKHKELAQHLGKVNECIGELKNITQLNELKEHIVQHGPFIPEAIEGSLKHSNPSAQSYVPLAQNLINTIEQLKHYRKKISSELHSIQRVGHIERHWIKYLAGSIALLATGYYVSQNHEELQNQLTEAYQDTKDGIYNFWNIHVKQAFSNAYNELFKSRENSPGVESCARQYRNIIEQWHPNISKEEIDPLIEQYLQTGEIHPDVIARNYEMLENPVSSVVSINPFTTASHANEGKSRLIFVGSDTMLRDLFQEFRNDATTLTKIGLISPALTIGIISLIGATKIANLFKQRQIYNPIKKYLLKMERKLNAQNNKSEKTDYADQGLMIYWGHELRKIIKLVPKEERYEFIKDIKEIERSDFTTQQKISTIKRMYRTYEFLYPVSH